MVTRFSRSRAPTASLVFALAVSSAEAQAGERSAVEPALQAKIDRAVERGKARLLEHQASDGSFPLGHDSHEPLVQTALSALALLRCGAGTETESVTRAFRWPSRSIAAARGHGGSTPGIWRG